MTLRFLINDTNADVERFMYVYGCGCRADAVTSEWLTRCDDCMIDARRRTVAMIRRRWQAIQANARRMQALRIRWERTSAGDLSGHGYVPGITHDDDTYSYLSRL